MNETLTRIFEHTGKFLRGQSTPRLLAASGVGIALVGALALLFMWAGETSYTPLMGNLNPEDAANIIRVLRDKKIPFKVDPTGKNISIPPESVHQLRLELATQGLPQSSVVGYEVFDKQSLGTTSFVQKINQKRALEGELMRTINEIRGVKRSRVHLAMPQKSTFVEDQKKSTASVVVDLEPGTVLTEKQVFGIGNLVARAVEGMDVGDVVIVDSNGKTLSKTNGDAFSAATSNQLEFQQKLEGDLEKRVETILGRVVGEGRVTAKVSADLDFSQIAETQTTYDADGSAIHSVERRNDNMNMTRPGVGGAAGATSNLPGQAPVPPNEIKSDTTKSNEVVNYNVPQTVRRVSRPSGTIRKLSVAVVMDTKQVKTTNKDGVVESKSEAWAPEKMKEFEQIVASALGIDKKRGDVLEIKSIDFTREDFDEASRIIAEKERKSYIQSMLVWTVIGLLIGLFFFFVVRPFIRWITENTVESVDAYLPQTIEELEKLQKNAALPGLEDAMPVLPEKLDPEKVEGEMIKEKIITLIDANPHKAALILKDWLHKPTEDKSATAEDKGGGKGKSA